MTSRQVLPFDLHHVMSSLKDFQRNTVEYAFSRLYGSSDSVSRFLIADEVGLGKTLVARGIIAKAVHYLWDKVPRIDVIYICSNADIARQNINRLNITQNNLHLTSRITLMPVEINNIKNNKLNFISFTPGTSFDLKTSLGTAKERALMYWLLNSAWGITGWAAPYNVLQGYATKESFRDLVDGFQSDSIDKALRRCFIFELGEKIKEEKKSGKKDIKTRFFKACKEYPRACKYENIPQERRDEIRNIIGDLRLLLARTCINALEPDLIILDEFQRFKNLLDGSTEISMLAHEMFNYTDSYSKARVLLLSATPYKMYTLNSESEQDDHFKDFRKTLEFLDKSESEHAVRLIEEYRNEVFRIGGGDVNRLQSTKGRLEACLKRVMVRTERLAITSCREGMLVEKPTPQVSLREGDVEGYLAIQKIAGMLGESDVLEYWKSAPFILNFMEDYKLKRMLKDALKNKEKRDGIAVALAEARSALFPTKRFKNYKKIDPCNARIRYIEDDMVGKEAWKLLWIAPSLPYYRLKGAFAEPAQKSLTKRLVFSSWKMVPGALAALLSYEVERLVFTYSEQEPRNNPDARKRRSPLLRFSRSVERSTHKIEDSAGERLTGMAVLGIIYPCSFLAFDCDPLRFLQEEYTGEGVPSQKEVVRWIERKIQPELKVMIEDYKKSNQEDESWYWAAPLLLDTLHYRELTGEWFSEPELHASWAELAGGKTNQDDDETLWARHVQMARDAVLKNCRLGRPPDDLKTILALMALGGPGVVSLRGLSRIVGNVARSSNSIKSSAGRMAWNFRALFNTPESKAIIRGPGIDEPYWKGVIKYAADGCIQAVIDEYVHILKEAEGLIDQEPEAIGKRLAEVIGEALTIRTSVIGADDFTLSSEPTQASINPMRLRGHFAMRFGQEKTSDEDSTRPDQVRKAFNSPFWPFVLASTSVGQEGLDFHTYCHIVVHWNLPPNPVDLEQREGRVHRYKGHAVRKNLAQKYGISVMKDANGNDDPWSVLFDRAKRDRHVKECDIVPYWVFPLEGGAQIERHVPMLPLSRESDRIQKLKRSLAVYRMVFGQYQQEDLMELLLDRIPEEEMERITRDLQISLEPPNASMTLKRRE